MKSKKKTSCRVQTVVEDYSFFVLDKLVGIKGKSVSDVVSFIVKDWIGDHFDELEKYGISARVSSGIFKMEGEEEK